MSRNGRGSTHRSARRSRRRRARRSKGCCGGVRRCPSRRPGSWRPSSAAMYPVEEPRLDRLVETLIAHRVQFVVVGGFAVIAHRFVRATEDSDIFVPDDIGNDRRCLAALTDLDGRRERDRAPLEDKLDRGLAVTILSPSGAGAAARWRSRPPPRLPQDARAALEPAAGSRERQVRRGTGPTVKGPRWRRGGRMPGPGACLGSRAAPRALR